MNLNKISIYKSSNIIIWIILFFILIPTTYVIINDTILLLEWKLINFNITPIIFSIIADKTGLIFSCVVLFISANVLSFSKLYIIEDKFKSRFTILVILFILSINLLIFIPHIIILLLGWDGLGLVSFILVMYYQNPSSLAAAILTALTNRIGDVTILLAIAISLNQRHWLIINIWNSNWTLIQITLITCAAITKRAQIPFSSWLPAAIAAPTPVSALVHSSTLVTAGVFLLIRFYPFLHTVPIFNEFILLISTSTIFIAGIRANTECDFKKIVALSTLSQLGVIIFSIGLNLPWIAFFHISTHALFKALLFICVGSFIHFHNHTQDLRWIGNITNQIPTLVSCIIISNIALCGFPFLAGFYSKDIIIEYAIQININEILLWVSLSRLGLTSFYSIRATIVGILSTKQTTPFSSINEPNLITSPTILLSIIATSIGAILSWNYPIFSSPSRINLTIKLMPIIIILIGFILGWIQTSHLTTQKAKLINISKSHYASSIIWFLVPLSTQFIFKHPINIAHNILKSNDQGWIEILRGPGIIKQVLYLDYKLITNTPNIPNSYIISAIVAIVIIIYIYCFNSLT